MMPTLANVTFPHDSTFAIFDDSGDPEYRAWLQKTYSGTLFRFVGDEARGYNAAMRLIWQVAEGFDHVFMVEDDFLFKKPVNLQEMADGLRHFPEVAQFVLLRQPWFGNEVAVGGLLPALEAMGNPLWRGSAWIEHRATWSTNPTLFRGGDWVKEHPWPIGEGSEYRFGQELFSSEPRTVCAYWGDGTEYVEHIGERKGFGY